MTRPLRIEYPGAIYHVMNRGWNRCPIFNDIGDRFLLFKTLEECVHRLKIIIHAFSLMPNHYHLLLETPHGNASRAMQYIDGVYTQRFNRKYGRDGSLFRGRYKSILVHKDSYFLELVRYIHMNGTKAKLVSTPEKDPFSSHKAYLFPQHAPQWLKTSDVLKFFDRDPNVARKKLNQFVKKEGSAELNKILKNTRWPAILGNDNFKKWIRQEFVARKDKPIDIPQDRHVRQKYPPLDIIHQVSKMYQTPEALIRNKSSGKNNEARRAAMILLRKYALLSYTEIGQLLGGVTYGAVSPVCRIGGKYLSKLFLKVEERLTQNIKYQL